MRTTVTPERDLAGRAGGRSWRITGGRPMLRLEDSPPTGWYLVELELDVGSPPDQHSPPVSLRFLPGSGSVPLARRPVPEVAGRRARVVFVPEGTQRTMLEISPWATTVVAHGISFRRLPQALAASIMSADVAGSATFGSTDRDALTDDLRAAHSSEGFRGAVGQIAISYEHLQHRRAGDSVDYPSWRMRHAVVFDDDADRLLGKLADLPHGGPLISVVTPVFDPDPRWLRSAIASVEAQIYERWELCLVDDASTDPEVRSVLDEAAGRDERIKVSFRAENGHIVAATNDALELATGDFVAFMDHDDELAPFALALVALASADADVLYTDEDKIDGSGRHFDPHCKPPWNPELLLGQNYLSHLTVIRRSLVDQVGGLRPGFEGSQDHDLVLRATAVTSPDRIVRVPFVAYHWRAIAGSTARGHGEKSYTEDASIRALEDRLGDGWDVGLASAPTAYRCSPPLDEYPLVSIIIPTRDRIDLLEACVESLGRTTYPAFEIIVVDNDSHELATLQWLGDFDNGRDRRVLPHPGVFNYSAVNNAAARIANGDLFCLLNNDTEVIEPDWLTEMVRWVAQSGVGAVGAKLLYGDGRIQHAGVVLGLGGLAGHGHHLEDRDAYGYFSRLTLAHEVGAVTGACLLTRRSTWESLGGLDEDLAVAFNDIDYCLRLRHEAGERIIWTPHALLHHHESISRGAEDDPIKVARFNTEVDRVLERWGHVLGLDPAYSPNLTLDADAFTLAREPRVTPPWRDDEDHDA